MYALEERGGCTADEMIKFCNPPAPGPESCKREIYGLSAEEKSQGLEQCATCIFVHARQLQAAGCTGQEDQEFCSV